MAVFRPLSAHYCHHVRRKFQKTYFFWTYWSRRSFWYTVCLLSTETLKFEILPSLMTSLYTGVNTERFVGYFPSFSYPLAVGCRLNFLHSYWCSTAMGEPKRVIFCRFSTFNVSILPLGGAKKIKIFSGSLDHGGHFDI